MTPLLKICNHFYSQQSGKRAFNCNLLCGRYCTVCHCSNRRWFIAPYFRFCNNNFRFFGTDIIGLVWGTFWTILVISMPSNYWVINDFSNLMAVMQSKQHCFPSFLLQWRHAYRSSGGLWHYFDISFFKNSNLFRLITHEGRGVSGHILFFLIHHNLKHIWS